MMAIIRGVWNISINRLIVIFVWQCLSDWVSKVYAVHFVDMLYMNDVQIEHHSIVYRRMRRQENQIIYFYIIGSKAIVPESKRIERKREAK